jgi:hypothetical protein
LRVSVYRHAMMSHFVLRKGENFFMASFISNGSIAAGDFWGVWNVSADNAFGYRLEAYATLLMARLQGHAFFHFGLKARSASMAESRPVIAKD